MIDQNGKEIETPLLKKYNGKISFELLLDNFVAFNTTMIPKMVFDHIGLFDEALAMGIDYDLWLRISLKYEFLYIPDKLVLYRIWDGQMSKNMMERFKCVYKIMSRFIGQNYGLFTKKQINQVWGGHYTTKARYFLSIGEKQKAFEYLKIAMKLNPVNLIVWKSLGKLILS
jgi:tetratricopeptide (TPR) repeat protein